MILEGSHTIDAPRVAVFAAICDPDVLLSVIPGCRAIERIGPDEYRGQISLRLPGIVGTYATLVRLVDADPPRSGQLEGEVEGALGTIRGQATFRLAESGAGTRIDYQGQAVIGGPLARLDSRFVEGLAETLIGQGLRSLASRLEGRSPVPGANASETPARETRA